MTKREHKTWRQIRDEQKARDLAKGKKPQGSPSRWVQVGGVILVALGLSGLVPSIATVVQVCAEIAIVAIIASGIVASSRHDKAQP